MNEPGFNVANFNENINISIHLNLINYQIQESRKSTKNKEERIIKIKKKKNNVT